MPAESLGSCAAANVARKAVAKKQNWFVADTLRLSRATTAFMSVREARLIVENWRREYNEERPHGALNQITPAAYAAGIASEQGKAA